MSGLALARGRAPGGEANLRWIDWIWHVRGAVTLEPGMSAAEALDRLEPLFRERGTRYERGGDALSFRKKDQPAQDRMAVFDSGTLRVEGGALRYDLASRMLLACFLAPLLFLAFAQATVVVGAWHQPAAEAPAAKPKALPMNPIDKALGAPEPEAPGKNGAEGIGRGKKPSHTPGYVFAGMFAVLYLVGRVLEARMVRALFVRKLAA
ncbi:MAG: hypothetical protein RIS94_2447 [Pseudomonadota bacterium]|jgi:hypothetical protein